MANLGKQADMADRTRAWTNDPYQLVWRREAFKGTTRIPMPLRERFESKLRPGPGDCWAWSGAHFKQNGYALLAVRSERDGKWRPTVAHRIAYELYVAEIPAGLVIDHLCRNHGCVNPWHMEPITRGENVRRGMHPTAVIVRENRCGKGHEFTDANTVIRKNGKRECRTCCRARDRARNTNRGRREHYAAMYQKRKAAAASR